MHKTMTRLLPWLPTAIAIGAMLCLTLQSPQETTALSGGFQRWLLSLWPKGAAPGWVRDEHLIRSLAHIPEYCILGCCFFVGFSSLFSSRFKVSLLTLASSSLVGLADEILNALLPTRHFETRDLGFNLLGAAIAVVGMTGIYKAIMRRRAAARQR